MLVRILHKLGLVKGIWLEDCEGEIYTTIKHKNPFGKKWAYVYPFTKIGCVKLNEDGTCTGKSSYIKRWIDF
jgi:hypothetical protein